MFTRGTKPHFVRRRSKRAAFGNIAFLGPSLARAILSRRRGCANGPSSVLMYDVERAARSIKERQTVLFLSASRYQRKAFGASVIFLRGGLREKLVAYSCPLGRSQIRRSGHVQDLPIARRMSVPRYLMPNRSIR